MNSYRKKIIRKEIVRHRMLIILVGLLLSIFLIFWGGNRLLADQARASDAYETVTVYTSVYINPGDTLWDIADRYMSDYSSDQRACVEELRRLNHMNAEEELKAGGYLLVPGPVSGN